jgi:hypothetical protein
MRRGNSDTEMMENTTYKPRERTGTDLSQWPSEGNLDLRLSAYNQNCEGKKNVV